MSALSDKLVEAITGKTLSHKTHARGEPTGGVMINGRPVLLGDEAPTQSPRDVLRDQYIEGVQVSADGSAITFLIEDQDPVTLTFEGEGSQIRTVKRFGARDTFQVEYAEVAINQEGHARLYVASEDAGSRDYGKGSGIVVEMMLTEQQPYRKNKLVCDYTEDHAAIQQNQIKVRDGWQIEGFQHDEFVGQVLLDPDDFELRMIGYGDAPLDEPQWGDDNGDHYWEDDDPRRDYDYGDYIADLEYDQQVAEEEADRDWHP